MAFFHEHYYEFGVFYNSVSLKWKRHTVFVITSIYVNILYHDTAAHRTVRYAAVFLILYYVFV